MTVTVPSLDTVFPCGVTPEAWLTSWSFSGFPPIFCRGSVGRLQPRSDPASPYWSRTCSSGGALRLCTSKSALEKFLTGHSNLPCPQPILCAVGIAFSFYFLWNPKVDSIWKPFLFRIKPLAEFLVTLAVSAPFV